MKKQENVKEEKSDNNWNRLEKIEVMESGDKTFKNHNYKCSQGY